MERLMKISPEVSCIKEGKSNKEYGDIRQEIPQQSIPDN
jgi:hypothetical protein